MTSGQDDRIQGSIEEIKGRAKSFGELAGDNRVKAAGELEQLKGKAMQAAGDLKEKAGQVLEDLDKAIHDDKTAD